MWNSSCLKSPYCVELSQQCAEWSARGSDAESSHQYLRIRSFWSEVELLLCAQGRGRGHGRGGGEEEERKRERARERRERERPQRNERGARVSEWVKRVWKPCLFFVSFSTLTSPVFFGARIFSMMLGRDATKEVNFGWFKLDTQCKPLKWTI